MFSTKYNYWYCVQSHWNLLYHYVHNATKCNESAEIDCLLLSASQFSAHIFLEINADIRGFA